MIPIHTSAKFLIHFSFNIQIVLIEMNLLRVVYEVILTLIRFLVRYRKILKFDKNLHRTHDRRSEKRILFFKIKD